MHLKDQLDRPIFFEHAPTRIVCIVPSLTELIVDLGLGDRLVGITKFCVHPAHLLQEKVVVGGTKEVHIDRIRSLLPDVVLCNKEENTPEIVEACSQIAPVHISDIKTLQDTYELIRQYGLLFSVEEKALKLITNIQTSAGSFRTIIEEKPVRKVAYLIWRKPYMAAGSDTFIDQLLKLNKFQNVFENKEGRYPEIDREELQDVDLVLLSSEPFPFKDKHIEEISQFTKAQILLVDGAYFSWYGSRLLLAFAYFTTLQNQFKKGDRFHDPYFS